MFNLNIFFIFIIIIILIIITIENLKGISIKQKKFKF